MATPNSGGSSMAVDSPNSDDDAESTRSLSPSITNYPIHWGRRYHRFKENSYLYPNDEPECDRLDFQHHLITDLHGGRLFFAPVGDPRKILDIGTGTGIWPISLAESGQFPNAHIIGTDLSPIQPHNVPEGVSFEIHDCTDADWNRALGSVDFIHTRMMLGSLSSFRSFVRNARRYLRPRTGWLECHELLPIVFSDDDSIPEGWPVAEWQDRMHKAATEELDPPKPVRIADKIKGWMIEAGYVDVHEHVNKMPLGAWPRDKTLKRIGRYWEENYLDGLPSWSYKLLGSDGLGWSREEIEVYLANVRSSAKDKKVHGYQKIYVVYGRRPSA